jgi:hypothetical protein
MYNSVRFGSNLVCMFSHWFENGEIGVVVVLYHVKPWLNEKSVFQN